MPFQVLENNEPTNIRDALLGGLKGMLGHYNEGNRVKKENEALKKLGIEAEGIRDPALRKVMVEKLLTDQQAQVKTATELQANKAKIRDLEMRRGLEPGSLDAYISDPKMAESVTREQKKTQASQPIDPEQLTKIQTVRNSPSYEKASPLRKYQMMTDAGVSKENAEAESKIAAEQEKPTQFESEADKLAAQSSSKYRDKLAAEYEGAQASTNRLKKMTDQAKSGKLSTPLMVKTLDYLGIPLGVLHNPDTEQYKKLESDFVKDVTNLFPGTIKNFEIESFMKTIPSLMNSDEGKVLVADSLMLMDEAKIIKYDAMKEILKENNGVVPRNLDMAVNDRTRDQMQDIKEKFLNTVHTSLDKSGQKIKMVDDKGNRYDIPVRHLQRSIDKGLKVSNE